MRVRLLTLLIALASAPATAATFIVTRADDPDPPPACASGNCTLRAAILAVNGSSGSDTIAFNVPVVNPGDVVTISPLTPLPRSATPAPRSTASPSRAPCSAAPTPSASTRS